MTKVNSFRLRSTTRLLAPAWLSRSKTLDEEARKTKQQRERNAVEKNDLSKKAMMCG
jgi:hypothetical protein